jgi:hypothetical protein
VPYQWEPRLEGNHLLIAHKDHQVNLHLLQDLAEMMEMDQMILTEPSIITAIGRTDQGTEVLHQMGHQDLLDPQVDLLQTKNQTMKKGVEEIESNDNTHLIAVQQTINYKLLEHLWNCI